MKIDKIYYRMIVKPKDGMNIVEFNKILKNILHNFGMIYFDFFLHDFVDFDNKKIENVVEVFIYHDLTVMERNEIEKSFSKIVDIRLFNKLEERVAEV